MLGGAVVVGSFAFINGLAALSLLFTLDSEAHERLFDINVALGTAAVTLTLGGILAYQAASALGGVGSSVLKWPRWKWLAPLMIAVFPLLVGLGQLQVNHPETAPWLFPLTNLLIVSIPSLAIALVVAQRYLRFNAWAWPLSWREWSSATIYGAIGATTAGGIINTLYLVFGAALLIHLKGAGDPFAVTENLPTLPRAWGVAFDISVLSVVAPLNEEFWKGMLVAFFFFRKGGAARCFLWGVLAGAGFNILETFQNSLSVISPQQVSAQQIGDQWWLFATARAGTGAVHSAATGFSALGVYGVLRGRPKFAACYFIGVLVHGSWNFLNFTLAGDAILSEAGPDSNLLDILSIAGMVALFLACVALLWEMPRRIRDGVPAPIYRALGMTPMTTAQRAAWTPPAPPAHTAEMYRDW